MIPEDTRIIIYTDSQNILGLPGRRERLEEHDYRSKNSKRIENYELYQEFYQTVERYDCVFVKVKGHQPSSDKLKFDHLFTLLDRAARNALRNLKKAQGE